MDQPVVLIADDNEAICTLITALLQPDFVADVAHDGAEAIERLKTRQYAAIVLDVRMPNVDGYHVLDFLKDERPELLRRVIIVTASVSRRELERARSYSVCAVVSKPFDVDALVSAVRECATQGGAPQIGGTLMASSMFFLIAEEVLRRVH